LCQGTKRAELAVQYMLSNYYIQNSTLQTSQESRFPSLMQCHLGVEYIDKHRCGKVNTRREKV